MLIQVDFLTPYFPERTVDNRDHDQGRQPPYRIKWALKKWDLKMRVSLNYFRIKSNDGHL
jgi:hypothetical protein